MQHKQTVIVVCRCTKTKGPFGITFESPGRGQWVVKWAFPLNDKNAGREGYGSQEVSGPVEFAPDYPGCPRCGAPTYWQCGSCRRSACWDGRSPYVTCPWCGADGTLCPGDLTLRGGQF